MEKIKNLIKNLFKRIKSLFKVKKTRRIIALGSAAVLILLLAVMPLIAKRNQEADGPQASILSGVADNGNINTELIGGGTLAEEDVVTVAVPTAVKLEKFLVANGDAVKQGDALAAVDRVTVMTAIEQVQETLEYLSEQIEEASGTVSTETVKALAGGTVKIMYAEKGESVQSVMTEHGALAVLSLDGLMAVDLETESTLATGTAVKVIFSDETAVAGKITKNLAGEMTVTVEDDDYAAGDTVQVTAEDGTTVGSGELYIYSPWNATAYTGTVSSVKADVGEWVAAGEALMELTDTGNTATYHQLVGQRQDYEDLMLELFKMYQTEYVAAPCDGVVSGIDKDSVQLLSAGGQDYTISFLANAPNGDDQTVYSNYVGKITTVASNGWAMKVNPQAIPVADYLDLTGVILDETLMTQTVLHTQTDIPVFTLTEGTWTQVDRATIGSGDILLFAADSQGKLLWSVLVQKAAQQPGAPGGATTPGGSNQPGDPSDPGTPTEPSAPTEPSTPTDPGANTDPGTSATPDGSVTPSIPSGGSGFPSGGSYPSGGNWGGTGGVIEQEPEFELYSLEMVQIASVAPQGTMTLQITVDELDINALQVGMTAQVKIDALGGEKYTATVTQVGNTGTNNGGSSKYTVELTMDRAENMLSGMNATAIIVLSTVSDVLTVPVSALAESGNQTVVYTRYNKKTDTLLDPVTVKVGRSDGETVEILEGLTKGQTYYYAYYDTLEISFTPDFGGGGFMGR